MALPDYLPRAFRNLWYGVNIKLVRIIDDLKRIYMIIVAVLLLVCIILLSMRMATTRESEFERQQLKLSIDALSVKLDGILQNQKDIHDKIAAYNDTYGQTILTLQQDFENRHNDKNASKSNENRKNEKRKTRMEKIIENSLKTEIPQLDLTGTLQEMLKQQLKNSKVINDSVIILKDRMNMINNFMTENKNRNAKRYDSVGNKVARLRRELHNFRFKSDAHFNNLTNMVANLSIYLCEVNGKCPNTHHENTPLNIKLLLEGERNLQYELLLPWQPRLTFNPGTTQANMYENENRLTMFIILFSIISFFTLSFLCSRQHIERAKHVLWYTCECVFRVFLEFCKPYAHILVHWYLNVLLYWYPNRNKSKL